MSAQRSPITTHVLDLAAGRPGEGIHVTLDQRDSAERWSRLAEGRTNADGRVGDLLSSSSALPPGLYRLRFDVGSYFASQGQESFYDQIPIVFEVGDPEEHYHVPLLLSPFGYSTYRGS